MINHRQLFLQNLAQTSSQPLLLEIVKAEGCELIDVNGKRYIDLISGIAVSNIGHCHPEVLKAVRNQSEQYMHVMVYGELVQSPQTNLAKALTDKLPPSLNCCYFVNSGAEAIEGALKLAKRFTHRSEIIAFKNAYHGSTHGGLSLNSNEYFKNPFRPLLPGIQFIDFNNFNDLEKITSQTAAVVTEIIRGEAGAEVPQKNFLESLSKRCRETGTLLIADEAQTGFGRTGTLFAFEQFDFVPDMLVLAKGMGGGMPIGAFIANKEVMLSLSDNPVLGHITTFGGHPVCCAASLATLEVISQLDLKTEVGRKEKLFRQNLKHPGIKTISGKGLLLGVEFESEQINRVVINRCMDKGLFTDWFLFAPNKMRIAPPLIIEDDFIIKSCAIILESIEETLHNSSNFNQ